MNNKTKLVILFISVLIILSTSCAAIWIINKTNEKSSQVVQQQTQLAVEQAGEEDPAQVAVKFVTENFTNNDYKYIIDHMYCDAACEQVYQKQLNMSFRESMAFDEKIKIYTEAVKINTIDAKEKEKTASKVSYDVAINYSPIVGRGSIGETWPLTLEKRGNKWMMNVKDIYGVISIYQNYIKILADMQKCRQAQPIIFNIPVEGGTFAVSDNTHPLYGFSIRMPKLKEALKLTISCDDSFIPVDISFSYRTLPISIVSDKVFSSDMIASESDIFPGIGVDIKKTEASKELGGKWPMIKIPYYDAAGTAAENQLPMIIGSDNQPTDPNANKSTIQMEYDTEKKVAMGYFSYLYKNLAVACDN